MKRRSFLDGVASTMALSSLAGCVTGLGESRLLSDNETPDTSGPHPVTPANTSFSVLKRSCGSGHDTAAIQFYDDIIIVDGTIVGSDGCATAELVAATLKDNVLTVVIATLREEDSEAVGCADCVTDVDYRFETTPNTHIAEVQVIHRSSTGEATVVTTDVFEPGKVVTP